MGIFYVVLAKSKIIDTQWEVIQHFSEYSEALGLIQYHGNSWQVYKIEKWYSEALK